MKNIVDLFKEVWFKVPTEKTEDFNFLVLEYTEDGKFQVLDKEGVKLPAQLDIEITQDLEQWQNGYCYAKVGMYLKAK
jgi:hypothetical protein